MEGTFLDAMSRYSSTYDFKTIGFLEYILLKYFNNNNIFMPIKDAIPFLEKYDKEQLETIAQEVWR
jgi:hypothetical protein|tara:strand:+ start:1619 stop:1816 length:198 start_codon:yes stop_codon:yes gene_type:complete